MSCFLKFISFFFQKQRSHPMESERGVPIIFSSWNNSHVRSPKGGSQNPWNPPLRLAYINHFFFYCGHKLFNSLSLALIIIMTVLYLCIWFSWKPVYLLWTKSGGGKYRWWWFRAKGENLQTSDPQLESLLLGFSNTLKRYRKKRQFLLPFPTPRACLHLSRDYFCHFTSEYFAVSSNSS